MSNQLVFESSPYLKQHQDNPVHWFPWGEKALLQAKKQNKLLIVSIGYAACHWCHVMERESFEKEDVAKVMNDHFISIKVDREERPDIDQVYMLAVQLITGQGGWPLNMICLPDGKPVYGGTYFRAEDWKSILSQLADKWEKEPEMLLDYAERLTNGIVDSESIKINRIKEKYSLEDLLELVDPWKKNFDKQYGGYKRVPKFPLPNNWLFLLRYGVLVDDQELVDHTHFTLRKIASGGIYDQLGGGFARYSVDGRWHIPHFEKMLYDNALLVSVYCEAYQQRQHPQYKRVIYETLAWVKREMTSAEGGFYSSLDADSDGVEGKYYTFTKAEFEEVLGEDANLFIQYFHITDDGNWEEEGTNVCYISLEAIEQAKESGFSEQEWEDYLAEIKGKLYAYREKRNRPALDNKILCAWNAMMLRAQVDAYRIFGEGMFLDAALKNATYIQTNLKGEMGNLLRQPANGDKAIDGFLDDYAFYLDALIGLYEATFDEKWLQEAKKIADFVIDHFYEEGMPAFFYTSRSAEKLIARKFDIMDDVIPASNSVLVRQLFALGLLFDETKYTVLSHQILANIYPQIKAYGSSFSNWSIRLLEEVMGVKEIALTGPENANMRRDLDQYYIPNKIISGGESSSLPLLKERISKYTKAYVCQNKSCSLPVTTSEELIKLIFKQESGNNALQNLM